jgi:L-iditol 2-dehydrogenase
MEIMGFHRDGGFAEYVTVPAQSVIALPDGLAPDQAVFAEPLSCCLNALELGAVGDGSAIAIWGAGPAGTLLSRAARSLGATPVSIEPDTRRREIIDGHAVCPDRLYDTCIVAVGDKTAYENAIHHLAPRGRLVVFSGLPPADDEMAVSLNQLHYHEQTVVGAYGCCYRHGVQALEAIAAGKVRVTDMISHRMPLAELDAALDLVADKGGMKILLYP